MIPSTISLGTLSLGTYPILLVITIFLSIFLFWRAGKHELVDSELIFDFVLVSAVGALLLGRIFDFLINSDLYLWQVKRLVFFNIYGGFDFYGAFLGAILAGIVFLRIKKINFWQIFDLGAAPLVFAQSLSALAIFLTSQTPTIEINLPWKFPINRLSLPILPLTFYCFLAYLVIFWILIRLETKKRHIGFFACFYLVSVSFVNLSLSLAGARRVPIGPGLWRFLIALGLVICGTIFWYILAKRKLIADLKSIFGLILLGIFRVIRMITSAEEAGRFSKTLLFSPFYLLRLLYFVVKLVCSQVVLGFVDFTRVFKGRK